MNLKNTVRKKIKFKRENLSLEEKIKLSTKITENFFKNFKKELEEAKIVMSYMDFKNEVMTDKLNKKLKSMGKKIVLPKVSEDKSRIIPTEAERKFIKGNFGILEPIGKEFLEDIDIVIVPGIAFNTKGERIGFGKGYYDKFFDSLKIQGRKVPLKISLIYNFQIDERFKGEEHDEKVDALVTETEVINFKL